METKVKFEKDYDCWYLTPAIGIAFLCFSIQIEIIK